MGARAAQVRAGGRGAGGALSTLVISAALAALPGRTAYGWDGAWTWAPDLAVLLYLLTALPAVAAGTLIDQLPHTAAEPLLAGGANDKSRGDGYVSRRVKVMADLKMRFDRKWTLTFDPFPLRPGEVRIAIDNGTLLPTLGLPGRILTTPGRTVDHLALMLDTGEVFRGDAAANMFAFAGTRHCTVFMTDMEQAYASWRKLLATGATTIYPAHGEPRNRNWMAQADVDDNGSATELTSKEKTLPTAPTRSHPPVPSL